MATTYESTTNEFLARYGITSETQEVPLLFLRDAEGVQRMHKHMQDLEGFISITPGDRGSMLAAR
ncbi:MAG: hypothetical protein WC796_03075 [Candidatus Pacearchaeota archaeon]|jgi:urease accessory protein UreE